MSDYIIVEDDNTYLGQTMWLPDLSYAFSLIPRALEKLMTDSMTILDLGAGRGMLSYDILSHFKQFRNIKTCLIDFSKDLLDEADQMLEDYEPRYECRQADPFKVNFKPRSFNHIVSSFAIHHCRGKGAYKRLYKKIYKWIKPPGMFICFDFLEGDNSMLGDYNEALWAEFLKRHHVADTDIKAVLRNFHEEDSPLSLKDHLFLLQKAGFKTVDLLWKKANFGIYLGIKE